MALHRPTYRTTPDKLPTVAHGPRLIKESEVCKITSLSKAEIRRRIARKKFPPAYKLTPGPRGRIAWREADVMAWLEALPRAA